MDTVPERTIHGVCSLELPHDESSVYTWDLHVPPKSKLVDAFRQPRAPLQVSEKIQFDTGVLATAKHYWIMTLDIAKIGLTFILPSEDSERKYTVEELRLDFFDRNSQKTASFVPHKTFQHNIMNQNEDFVESELHLSHPVLTEHIETIRIIWTIKAKIGRVGLKKIQKNLDDSPKEDPAPENFGLCDFSDLYLSEKLSDLTIQCQGEKLPAHRAVLFGKSPVFSAMFLHEMRENKEKLLTVEDICPEILKEMLRYMYTGKINRLDDICYELLPVSEKYQLLGLKMMCEMSLEKKVTPANAMEMYGLSDIYGAMHLKRKCLKVLKLSKSSILQNRVQLREMNKKQPELVFDLLFD